MTVRSYYFCQDDWQRCTQLIKYLYQVLYQLTAAICSHALGNKIWELSGKLCLVSRREEINARSFLPVSPLQGICRAEKPPFLTEVRAWKGSVHRFETWPQYPLLGDFIKRDLFVWWATTKTFIGQKANPYTDLEDSQSPCWMESLCIFAVSWRGWAA